MARVLRSRALCAGLHRVRQRHEWPDSSWRTQWAHVFPQAAAFVFGIDLLTGAAFGRPHHVQATLERRLETASPLAVPASSATREGLVLPVPPVERSGRRPRENGCGSREGTVRTSKALTLALALLWPVAGGAQDRAFDRGFVDVNAVSQASSSPRVRHMLRYPPSDPTQRYQVGYEVPDGPAFDISGGMRISPNLSVGLAVSRFGRSSRTDVDSVDVFARRGTVVHLGHRQRGYHLQTSWVVRVADRLDVAFFAGPSLFSVLQTRVTDVAVREVEPWSGSDLHSGAESHGRVDARCQAPAGRLQLRLRFHVSSRGAGRNRDPCTNGHVNQAVGVRPPHRGSGRRRFPRRHRCAVSFLRPVASMVKAGILPLDQRNGCRYAGV